MTVGHALSPFQQDAITAVLELSSREALKGPVPGLNEPQERLIRSQNAVRAGGGTIAGGLQSTPDGSPEDLMSQASANIMAAIQVPQRMFIQSLDYPEEVVQAQFNPEKLKETIGVDWQKFRIPGLSHQRLQYGSANSVEYRFELYFDASGGSALRNVGGAFGDMAASQLEKNLAARRQLHAWTLRRRQETLGNIGDTQRLLFVWPNLITLTCVPVSIEFEYTAFNLEGAPTAFKAEIFVQEIRDAAMFAEDVQLAGTQRGSGNLEVY